VTKLYFVENTVYGSMDRKRNETGKKVDRKRKETEKGELLRIYSSRQEKEVDRKRNETGKRSRQEKKGDRKGKKPGKGRIQAFWYTYLRSAWKCIELA
jgi:hypothetical protein